MGQNIPGEGVYGVADSFLAGGAASVVSTLWRIESDSSALFARRYYEFLIQTHNAATAPAGASVSLFKASGTRKKAAYR